MSSEAHENTSTGLRTAFTIEPTRVYRIDNYPFEHEVRVALPPSYGGSTRSYPVLWVTDNVLELTLAVIGHRELIVVSIGGRPPTPGYIQNGRTYDFYAQSNIYPGGAAREYWAAHDARQETPVLGGGAPRFRDFLVDRLRPELELKYRMEPDEHTFEGHSAGGWFAMYVMLTRPEAFTRYIVAAPALNWCDGLMWQIEEEFAAAHDDLPVSVYFSTGDAEMTTAPALECFSSMAKMIERLSFRAYPSLDLRYSIVSGGTHASSLPHILSGAMTSFWP